MAIILCSIVMNYAVEIIVAYGALLLAGELDPFLDVHSVVAFFEVHHPFVEDEPFQVYY